MTGSVEATSTRVLAMRVTKMFAKTLASLPCRDKTPSISVCRRPPMGKSEKFLTSIVAFSVAYGNLLVSKNKSRIRSLRMSIRVSTSLR